MRCLPLLSPTELLEIEKSYRERLEAAIASPKSNNRHNTIYNLEADLKSIRAEIQSRYKTGVPNDNP